MKKTYYGISMGPVNMAQITPEGIVTNDSDTYLYSYLMRQLILEFLNVEAKMLSIVDEMDLVCANTSSPDIPCSGMLEERCVFSFETEECFSDIVKTADLVIEDFMESMIESAIAGSDINDKTLLRVYFKRYFKAFCVEQAFDEATPEDEIVTSIFRALDRKELSGREIQESEKTMIADFLSRDSASLAIGALSI